MVALQTTVVPEGSSSGGEFGSILVSPDGRIVKLNVGGTLIWKLLWSCKPNRGLTLTEIISILDATAGGRSEINDEVQSFLSNLVAKGLLVSDHQAKFFVNDDVVWSGNQEAQRSISISKTKSRYFKSERLQTLQALFWLMVYAALIRLQGFPRVRWFTKTPLSGPAVKNYSDEEAGRQVCAAVDRAQVYLFRQALCMQRSVVIAVLLRKRGVAAEVVMAAHLMPFKSHAWVEVDGNVVNDSPNVQRYYDVVIQRM